MSFPIIWKREAAFGLYRFLKRRDLPGAWKLKQILDRTDFTQHARGPIRCSTNHGFQIVVDPAGDKGVERSIVNEGTYEEGTLYVFAHVLKAGDTFLDIGANVGLMSLYAARAVGPTGRVESFEPLPEIAELLEESARVNSLRQIRLNRFALGSKQDRKTIHRNPAVNRGSASLAWSSSTGEATEVTIDTLDSWSTRAGLNQAAMVKVDVEGWELEVINGGQSFLSSPSRPVLCVEFSASHPMAGGSLSDLFSAIVRHGYNAYVLTGTKANPSPLRAIELNSIPEHDNVFFFPTERPAFSFGLTIR
jgi:FkbM family methyltransferase